MIWLCNEIKVNNEVWLLIHAKHQRLIGVKYSMNGKLHPIYIFEVKLLFEMLTVRGKRHFSTHERVFLWKCQSFETENVSTWGGLEPPTIGFIPNALTYWAIRARHLLSHVFNTVSGGIDIFETKLTFEMLTVRGQQHSFSTHERCSCESVKVLRQKMSRPEGDSNPQPSDSSRML